MDLNNEEDKSPNNTNTTTDITTTTTTVNNNNNIIHSSPQTQQKQDLIFRDVENDDFDYSDTTNQLIANLGHDLQDVRMRALKCIWRKIDCGLISSDSVSQRIDLLNRLTSWIRNDDPRDENFEGFQLVIRLFTRLAQHDEFRKLFIGNHLDTLLSKRRLEFGGEIRSSINRLLDRVGSFYIHCEGPADDSWQGNLSVPTPPLRFPTEKGLSSRNIALSSFRDMDEFEKYSEFSGYEDVPAQNFFPAKSKSREPASGVGGGGAYIEPWRKLKVHQSVAIKTIRLGPSDRRVLSSTVESLSSKNENLVFMTCSFVRDVLLNDFPPEVFIQESAVSLSLAQIVQDSWMDEKVNYVAFQALLKLARSLRFRFCQLNSSELHGSENAFVSETKGPQGYYGDSYPLSAADLSASNSDYFAGNICKILRVLSRSILFDSNRVTRWVLLSSFTVTFLKCVQIFPSVSTKNLMMLLQEILYDLKSSGDTYSNSYSSRPLAPFQPADDDEVIFGDYLLESISYAYQGKIKDGTWEDPLKAIVSYLIDVQNSSGHKGVYDAIHKLKEYSFVLLIKSRKQRRTSYQERRRGKQQQQQQQHSSRDIDYETIFRNPHWREAFYRFLSVEPTSQEDESLLVRVLDLLSFILTNIEESFPLLEWIVPLCGSKNCAGLRLLVQHCSKNEVDSSGTTLPIILRSLFDFYHCILTKELGNTTDECTLLWELFGTCSQILSDAADDGFTSSASVHGVLYGITYLTAKASIQEKLQKNRGFVLGLLNRVCGALEALGERSSVDSFRNRGPIHYAAFSMLHLIIILDKSNNEKEVSWEWINKCIDNIAFLWTVESSQARAVAFQICQILCASKNGAAALLSGLDPPSLLWGMPYRHLSNPSEAPVVQYRATAVLLNLQNNWRDLGKISMHAQDDFPLTMHEYLEDLVKLASHVYWHAMLNRCGSRPKPQREQSESSDDSGSVYSFQLSARSEREESDDMSSFITPPVLNHLCKLFLALVNNFLSENELDAVALTKSPFVQHIMSSGISSILFRLLSKHEVLTAPDMTEESWIKCCSAFSSVVQVLISISQLDRNASVILIGDKRNLSHLIQLFLLRAPSNCGEKTKEALYFLWVNAFTLLSILCVDAGENFEDFSRNVWSHWGVIFPKIYMWLQNEALIKFRQTTLTFVQSFLSMTTKFQADKDGRNHPILCDGYWQETGNSYGATLCNSLKAIIAESLDIEERVAVLHTFAALFNLSPNSRNFAIDIDLVSILIEKLRGFGVKYFEPSETNLKKKTIELWHDETFWILSVLTSLLYDNERGREQALKYHLADTIHKIFKWWTMRPDRILLHAFIECLLNFTEEFPQGAHSLTITTSLVGVTPRKVVTPQSLFIELLNITQNELNVVDKNPALKTIELCFSLLRNCTFVVECRTIIAKTSLLSFIRRLHANETKRWGPKQNYVKDQYLQFLVHLTINSDVQILLPKVPEAIEILLALTSDQPPVSLLSLKVLRNLSFNSGNRPRFLCDATFIPTLVLKLRNSKDPEELEAAGVTLWALVANSEKGKLLAKKSSCGASILSAMQRLRKMEKSSNDLCLEKHDFTQLISTLSKVAVILGEEDRPLLW